MRGLGWGAALWLCGCSLIVPGPDDFTYGEDAGARQDAALDGGGDRDASADAGPTCGMTLCGTDCVDTQTSLEHCGRCDVACATGEECRAGECFDPVVQISSGATHNCARRATGNVICWGYNEQGQIGDATIMMRSAPVEVGLPAPSAQVAAGGWTFSSGHGFTCSRDAAGAVLCWGEQAPLGSSLIQGSQPEPFMALGAATHLSLGDEIGCAILASGRLECWGVLPGDSSVSMPMETSPAGLSGSWVKTVDVGSTHLCATSRDGGVYCVGSNNAGQLGADPMTLPESSSFVAIPGISDAEAVTVNGGATCVLRAGGQVSCWGLESALGIGSTAMDPHPTPEDVPGLSDVSLIDGGAGIGLATCALRSDASLTCWGYDFRQPIMGDTSAPSPYGLPGSADVVDFELGSNHMCVAHDDGTASCIGRNFWGTLGDGTEDDSTTFVEVMLP